MTNYDSSAALEFMRDLFDEKATTAVKQIAELPYEQRAEAMRNPRACLERVGLRTPEEVSVAIMEATADELGEPGCGSSGSIAAASPGGTGVLEPGGGPRQRWPTCIRWCFPAGSLEVHVPKRCVWICL